MFLWIVKNEKKNTQILANVLFCQSLQVMKIITSPREGKNIEEGKYSTWTTKKT